MDWTSLLGFLPVLIPAAAGLALLLLLLSRWEGRREETDWVRAALRVEIDHNLKLLRESWTRLRPREGSEDEVHSLQKRRYALEFARWPLPPFSRDAYSRHFAFITDPGHHKGFAAVIDLYDELARLEEIRHELRAALAVGAGPTGAYDEFLRVAGRSWDDVWHRIERLLEKGNPLAR
ncbi:MAG: hypothetical protein ACM3JD_19260 [Rudaea sp.]